MCFEPEVIWRYSILTIKEVFKSWSRWKNCPNFSVKLSFLKFQLWRSTSLMTLSKSHTKLCTWIHKNLETKTLFPEHFFIGSVTSCGVAFFYFSYFWCFFLRAHLKEYSHDWILMNSFESPKIHSNQCLKPEPLLWPKLYIIPKVKNNLSMWVIWWFIM